MQELPGKLRAGSARWVRSRYVGSRRPLMTAQRPVGGRADAPSPPGINLAEGCRSPGPAARLAAPGPRRGTRALPTESGRARRAEISIECQADSRSSLASAAPDCYNKPRAAPRGAAVFISGLWCQGGARMVGPGLRAMVAPHRTPRAEQLTPKNAPVPDTQRRDHRPRRPWEDDPGRRDAQAGKRLPREPGFRRADHGPL